MLIEVSAKPIVDNSKKQPRKKLKCIHVIFCINVT
jgi:hypothetical protein